MADLSIETAVLLQHGPLHIAGIDEAGRGALAGPVVAAAVILPLDNPNALAQLVEVNDSKQLTPQSRERLFSRITHHASSYAIALESAEIIDEIGILPATKRAMVTAVTQLPLPAQHLLIDGNIRLPTVNLPQQAIIRGDTLSLSIAAAAILAKVTRDRLMVELDAAYPAYGFARHKGYGTAVHLHALAQHGPCPHHRYTFAPIRPTLIP
ncbi:MAG: ribonuclease HII [Chloroflexi bacterium]|nr:ribonuclease HII [Ardenticatenaceae bacterium]MBL1127062.1 ribonuclease HII [Chloroflexota bacterium]NOG33124.1 ribonuclease HII [Chloroflexota bacterium]GIK54918.1 MAG: ribonuclease HII [Chloroflexota bacterium]